MSIEEEVVQRISDLDGRVARIEALEYTTATLSPRPSRSVTGNTTLDPATDYTLLVDASSGNITITLCTAAAGTNLDFRVKKIDATAYTVTIDGSGSETIDDALTVTLTTQYEAVCLYSDGSEWWLF